jgi:hypothetical protein
MGASLTDGHACAHTVLARPMSAPERAHAADSGAAVDAVYAILTPAQSALSQLRLGGGAAYLDAAAAVTEQLAVVFGALADANASRLAVFGARCAAAAPPFGGRFFCHLAATADGWVPPHAPQPRGGGMLADASRAAALALVA